MFQPNNERIPRKMPFPLQRNVTKGSAKVIFGLIGMVGIGGGMLLGSPYFGNRHLPNSGSKMGEESVYIVPKPKASLLYQNSKVEE